ncbi:hypothetical protein J5Y04_16950 [Kitasatospora sp. RG8]|uniref:hypothetical protein n=1 Tax=Kitasatospora sp. RG8 TaxID=2820815 RepID=UPI001AE0A976|nr:hypothetical protein [Kitasatospora sp. RG8]MBP0451217.1 hypothetical protein [Kitasatospora sp. RG8]
MTIPWTPHRTEFEFRRLSGLLGPGVPVAATLSAWDAGEPELALEDLVDQLSDHHTPLLRADRAALLDLAEALGVSAGATSALRWCPDLEAAEEWWWEVENSPRATAIASELLREIAPGHPLHGIPLTPWLECGACDDVLVRLDDENARTGRTPYRIAVIHPTWSRHPETPPSPVASVYDQALHALDQLETCFHSTPNKD